METVEFPIHMENDDYGGAINKFGPLLANQHFCIFTPGKMLKIKKF